MKTKKVVVPTWGLPLRALAIGAFLLLLLLQSFPGCDGLAKSRHRHRRVPAAEPDPLVPDSSSSAISRRLKEEQQQNKFKPEFKNCEDYRPEVQEESVRGRIVLFNHFVFTQIKPILSILGGEIEISNKKTSVCEAMNFYRVL